MNPASRHALCANPRKLREAAQRRIAPGARNALALLGATHPGISSKAYFFPRAFR